MKRSDALSYPILLDSRVLWLRIDATWKMGREYLPYIMSKWAHLAPNVGPTKGGKAMMEVRCMGHVTDEGNKVKCNKFLGNKPGPEGAVSHGVCPDCKAVYEAQMPSVMEKLRQATA